MDPTKEFQDHREHLFAIAYRMLGSVCDAEDTLQDSYLRWREVDTTKVDSPRSYLSTMVVRGSIDKLRQVKARREEYIGTWLPQPIISETLIAEDPCASAESLSLAFLVVLERLNPIERAVFLLRESFEFSFEEIAVIVQKNEANCRQIFGRARDHIRRVRPRFSSSPSQQLMLAMQFHLAVEKGDLCELIALLSEDVRVYSDGGGKVSAARHTIEGQDRASRFLLGVRKFSLGMPTRPVILNGQPGLVVGKKGALYAAAALDILGQKIRGVHIIRNPEKLALLKLG